MQVHFSKMHGLGNDFMVLDLVSQRVPLTTELIQQLAHRHTGIGFNQLLIVEAPTQPDVDFSYRIFNADGSEVEQCGNGVRCFARFVHERHLTKKRRLRVATTSGIVEPELGEHGWVRVNMGLPQTSPERIPFKPSTAQPVQQSATGSSLYPVHVNGETVLLDVVNMGNPHAVLVVDAVDKAPVGTLGAALESHEQFPARVNVGFMQVITAQSIKLRVFERGTGETLACGTGACAAVVSGVRQGLLTAGVDIQVQLPGGVLYIRWQEGDVVWMTGPTETVFEGTLHLDEHFFPVHTLTTQP